MRDRYNLIFLIPVFFVLFVFLTSKPTLLFAQGSVNLNNTSYELLAPLPIGAGYTEVKKPSTATYIPGMITLVIGLAGALAVIQIIIGGFQYISSEGFGKTSKAKETIQNALLGLLLVIGSYSLLYTINPKLVNLDLSLEVFPAGPDLSTDLGNDPYASIEAPSSTPPPPGPSAGTAWYPDKKERDNIYSFLGTAGINQLNCKTIGEKGCTSVYGIGPLVISKLKELKNDCKCGIVVTGGTEYWLHGNRSTEMSSNPTAHKPGGNAVDLSLSGALSNYIRANGQPTTTTGCSIGVKYWYKGGLYVDERISTNGSHWHVCYSSGGGGDSF